MDDNQKRYFLAVCRAESISKAADELYISRQALSSSINRIESEIGVKLFSRKGNKTTINSYGERLLICLTEQEKLWQECIDDMAKMKGKENEIINIALGGSTLKSDDYNLYFQFEKETENITINFVGGDLDENIKRMQNGEIDFIISIYTSPSQMYYRIKLDQDPRSRIVHLLVSKNSPLAQLEAIDFMKDLSGQTLLYEGNYLPDDYRKICRQLSITMQSITADRRVISNLIAKEKACLYMPIKFCDRFINENVVSRPLLNLPLNTESYLLYKGDISENVRRLIHKCYMEYNKGQDIILPDEHL